MFIALVGTSTNGLPHSHAAPTLLSLSGKALFSYRPVAGRKDGCKDRYCESDPRARLPQ